MGGARPLKDLLRVLDLGRTNLLRLLEAGARFKRQPFAYPNLLSGESVLDVARDVLEGVGLGDGGSLCGDSHFVLLCD